MLESLFAAIVSCLSGRRSESPSDLSPNENPELIPIVRCAPKISQHPSGPLSEMIGGAALSPGAVMAVSNHSEFQRCAEQIMQQRAQAMQNAGRAFGNSITDPNLPSVSPGKTWIVRDESEQDLSGLPFTTIWGEIAALCSKHTYGPGDASDV